MHPSPLRRRARMTKPKLRTCGNPSCKKKFPAIPGANSFIDWCSVDCGIQIAHIREAKALKQKRLAQEKQERELKARWRREKQEFRAKNNTRGRAKSGPERQAQDAVNAYIMVRDANKPCIVHGYWCPNAAFHAGHFQPVSNHPELRFNTWNIHKQCALSNTGSQNRAKWGGRSTDQMYEAGLVERIGQARVDWLKGPHSPLQPRDEYLERVKKIFTKRARHLKKLRGYE